MTIRSANREAARLTRAVLMADLLDAAAISPGLAEHMDSCHWKMLADAARIAAPGPKTCRLVISLLQARLRARRQLSRLRISTMLHDAEPVQLTHDNSDESVTRRPTA